MKTKLVHSDFDLDNPPPLSAAEQAQLARLAEMQDEDIDTSDIPPLTETFSANAVHFRDRHLYKAIKKQVTVRLDADVLE
jgi:uncharacterized protein (DUF4415 family)